MLALKSAKQIKCTLKHKTELEPKWLLNEQANLVTDQCRHQQPLAEISQNCLQSIRVRLLRKEVLVCHASPYRHTSSSG